MAEPSLADDVLRGARAIALYLYGDETDEPKIRRAIRAGQIPTFRIGGTICARKSTILQWIRTQELSSIVGNCRNLSNF